MQMHHSEIKSNFAEPTVPAINNNVPVCPKPLRLGSTLPDFLKNQGSNVDSKMNGTNGLHNMIADKVTEAKETRFNGCSSYCYSGSPPGRSGNPLIHDVQFIHQMELFPPLSRT